MKLEVTDGALKAIERFKSEIKEEIEPDIRFGVSCKNAGCNKVCLINKFQNSYVFYSIFRNIFLQTMM